MPTKAAPTSERAVRARHTGGVQAVVFGVFDDESSPKSAHGEQSTQSRSCRYQPTVEEHCCQLWVAWVVLVNVGMKCKCRKGEIAATRRVQTRGEAKSSHRNSSSRMLAALCNCKCP